MLPLVSIILATYNRSPVLAHAIESVRRSTLTDWELIVVGDGCTDDTAAVVASFDDPRVTFINLPRNVGEQSGPNNEGLRLARGRYIAAARRFRGPGVRLGEDDDDGGAPGDAEQRLHLGLDLGRARSRGR